MEDLLLDNLKALGREPGCSVRVASIGCGYWGKNLVSNFAELSNPNRVAAEELADSYHAPVAEFTVGCGCDPGEARSRLRS
jgi:hypothetical protein